MFDEHMKDLHKPSNKRHIEMISPSSSPPHKKLDGPKEIFVDISEPETEMMDIEIEANDLINNMLQQRIKELEANVVEMEEQKKKDEEARVKLEQEVIQLRSERSSLIKLQGSNIPKHLSAVKEKHLSKLRGYKMKYNSKPNGACLENSASVHFYEDEGEGEKLKRRINNHIADNWDNFYQYKIALPYTETVGVGEKVKMIEKSSKEEMIQFLRSEESLTVYSNYQELLAMANLFNININIFTYSGDDDGRWSVVHPDPEMVSSSEKRLGKCFPDMALYNCDQVHYDLRGCVIGPREPAQPANYLLKSADFCRPSQQTQQIQLGPEYVMAAENTLGKLSCQTLSTTQCRVNTMHINKLIRD